MDDASRVCCACKFWVDDLALDERMGASRFMEWGECRVSSPVLVGEGVVGVWPVTRDESWCGEWEP